MIIKGDGIMFSINRSPYKVGVLTLLLIVGLTLLVGCDNREDTPGIRQPEIVPGFLIITGSGVESETRFTLDELKNMEEGLAGACYSAVNNWPAQKFFVGKGVKVSYLLKKAGIKDEAQTIIVWAGDGYSAAFTREQLEEKRFCFPNLREDSEEGAREVPAILAWEHWEGSSDLSKAASGKLGLFLGQKGLNDAVTPVYVKDVVTLEVLSSPPGQWDVVQAEPAPGKVKSGTQVVLTHPQLDQVKIYYTVDGSTPDEKSRVYNPSTTYFQPDLIQPITINESMIIKTRVMGFGKYDSPEAAFAYEVE
jgi:hypothetical protein